VLTPANGSATAANRGISGDVRGPSDGPDCFTHDAKVRYFDAPFPCKHLHSQATRPGDRYQLRSPLPRRNPTAAPVSFGFLKDKFRRHGWTHPSTLSADADYAHGVARTDAYKKKDKIRIGVRQRAFLSQYFCLPAPNRHLIWLRFPTSICTTCFSGSLIHTRINHLCASPLNSLLLIHRSAPALSPGRHGLPRPYLPSPH